jgi:hypothetical protein
MLVPDFKQLNITTAMHVPRKSQYKQVQVALKFLLFNQKQKFFRETTTLIAYFQ